MQQKTIVSSKKIAIVSDFLLFDLLPIKKYQQCSVRIPQTILLEKGYIKDWIFNSKKHSNHPILKKKRQNMSPLVVVKTFCSKFGFHNATYHCNTVGDVRDECKIAFKQQKDYDFVRDKKVIQIRTLKDQILSMSLIDFLDFIAQNKYSDQNFHQKWKIIQQKISFTKIDQYFEVQSVRHNHSLQSKCQKIISVNTTETTTLPSQIEDDKYKNSSPSKNFTVTETKNLQGYKFFDTFLNKKFFQMSAQIVQFIQKNFKCIVEELTAKFVINKDRQPFLVGIYKLQIKPAKKITNMTDFKIQKKKGYLKLDQYLKFLEVYISQNVDRFNNVNSSSYDYNKRNKKCKGKFCKIPVQDITLPPLRKHIIIIVEQKLKLPSLSAASRYISIQLRDAIVKRQKKVIQILKQNKIIQENYQHYYDQSSQYETSQDQDQHYIYRGKSKQVKICQKCFVFYFHVNRFFELDSYNNIIQKKIPIAPNKPSRINSQKKLDSRAFSYNKVENKKVDQEKNQIELKPIITQNLKQKTQSKKNLTPLNQLKPSRSAKNLKYAMQLNRSQNKLMPLQKKTIVKQTNQKVKTLMSISKNTNFKTSTYKKAIFEMAKQKRPQNFNQALEQILKKLSGIPDSSRQQFKYYAKKYYKDNLPQPIQRKSFSTFSYQHLYQFMNNSPISIQVKQRIKKRPQMSLKRLSELTDYPQIVSKSEFIFDTLIVNQQMTIPFCVITTKVINPDNIKSGVAYQNIFIINDIFDAFIEYISVAKQLLQDQQLVNKRIILFNYPGQSHTIYNEEYLQGIAVSFGYVLDKLIYRLSSAKNQLKIINLKNDKFKFCGFGYGGYLLSTYLGSYHSYFPKIQSVLLINSFMEMPKVYKQMLQNLLTLYSSGDPTVQQQAYLFYNKAINSSQIDNQDLQHKAGLNPIRIQDRQYLLRAILKQQQQSRTDKYSIAPIQFEKVKCPVTVIYGRNNAIIPKQNSKQYLFYQKNKSKQIPNRIHLQISSGHDIFADNYDDIFRALTLFARK